MELVKTILAAIENSDVDRLANLFLDAGLEAPSFQWRPTDSDLIYKDLKFGLSYWSKLRNGSSCPHYKQIDAVDLKPVLGYVALIEPVRNGEDFRIRVYGSSIATRTGYDLTGWLISALPVDPFQSSFMLAGHSAVARRLEPLLSIHTAPRSSTVQRWRRLLLPFVNDDGALARCVVINSPDGARVPSLA